MHTFFVPVANCNFSQTGLHLVGPFVQPFSDADEQLAKNTCAPDSDNDTVHGASLDFINPHVDYTPPTYVTLLFTDLGLLTPSAVGDNLLQLYY